MIAPAVSGLSPSAGHFSRIAVSKLHLASSLRAAEIWLVKDVSTHVACVVALDRCPLYM